MYYGRHFRSRRRRDPAADVRDPDAVGNRVDAHAPGRQRHVGLGIITSAKDAALRELKDVDTWMRTWRSYPARRALGRRRAARRRRRDHGQDRGSPPLVRRRRHAGRHRRARGRRLVGVHQPVARARRVDRLHARGRAARPVARSRRSTSRWSSRSAGTRSTDGDRRAVLPRHARLRPAPPRRDRRGHRGQGRTTRAIRSTRSRRRCSPRRARTPTCSARSSRSPACSRVPDEVLAQPGVFEKVVELGAGWRDEPVFAPTPRGVVGHRGRLSEGDDMKIDSSGVTLDVQVEGEGRPVVLLHGFPDTKRLWSKQVPGARRRRVPGDRPDQRGYGASDKPAEVEAYSIPFLAIDVTAILDHLGIEQRARRRARLGRGGGVGDGVVRARARRSSRRAVGRAPDRVREHGHGAAREVVVHAAVPVRATSPSSG